MIVNGLKKYIGVIFFYLAIVGMICLINARFNYLNNNTKPVTYAIAD